MPLAQAALQSVALAVVAAAAGPTGSASGSGASAASERGVQVEPGAAQLVGLLPGAAAQPDSEPEGAVPV